MAIDLSEKNNHDIRKTVEYNDEDFSNVNLDTIRDNKRIFIPCDELPEDEKKCCSYLDSLIAFIERETGIHCSYIFVKENEPYEVNGSYIQVAPELMDCHRIYIKNGDVVYDRRNHKWHVSYYYKDNAPHIILDDESGDYQVVNNLSDFSSQSGLLIPLKAHKYPAMDNAIDMKKRHKNGDDKSFHIGRVIAAALIGLLGIVIIVLLYELLLNDFVKVVRLVVQFIPMLIVLFAIYKGAINVYK